MKNKGEAMCFFRKFKERVKPVTEKDIASLFDFLVKDYGFTYSFQKLNNCFGGNWYVETYSFYNDSGCFTIRQLCQRGEWDYFFARKYCKKNLEELCSRNINIHSIEKEIWEEPLAIISELGHLKSWNATYKIEHIEIETLAKVIKAQIEKHASFGE